jgi:hypothetical protein
MEIFAGSRGATATARLLIVIEGDGLCLSAGTTLLGQRGEEKTVVVRRENTASAKERCMVLPIPDWPNTEAEERPRGELS